MPQVRFTNAWLQSVKPDPTKGVWYSEAGGKGLRLYVGVSGKKTWYINYRQPGDKKLAQHKIGDADLFSVSLAREAALKFLASVANGESPWEKPEAPKGKLTLKALVQDFYGPWVTENRRAGDATLALIQSSFDGLLGLPVEGVTVEALEQWRIKKRQTKGLKASSLNRQITALKAALNWGVKRGIIEANNMSRLEKLREDDSDTKLRYLSPEERERLFVALDAREGRDYLKLMITVSLNTGIRRGSLFSLLWSDIDFQEGILTVRPVTEKTGKLIRIPMNSTLVRALQAWKEQSTGGDLVFPSPKTGGMMDNCKKAWASVLKAADIKGFRWHDMRHDFASQLVMRGVDLNTVRELLGHSDMKMTLRYAHLAPQVKRAAVEMLG